MSRKNKRPFWIPYCGYGPGWCAKIERCPGLRPKQWNAFDEPVRGCPFLRVLHPWTELAVEEFKAIVWYAYHHPLKVKIVKASRGR